MPPVKELLGRSGHGFIGHKAGPVQILVDDRPSNCENWGRAGGLAILHRTADLSVAWLESTLAREVVTA